MRSEQPCCFLKCKMLCEVELAQKKTATEGPNGGGFAHPLYRFCASGHASTKRGHNLHLELGVPVAFLWQTPVRSQYWGGGLLCTFTNPRLLTGHQTSWAFTRGVALKNANREKNGRFPQPET